MADANGHAQGRVAPPLPEYTFPDSGYTVRLRKVSPMLRDDLEMDLRRKHPAPTPPVITTELGTEENPADPAYQAALLTWNGEHYERLGEAWFRALVDLGVECEIDDEAVARVRAWAAARDLPLDADDKYVFVRYCCVTTQEAIREFRDAASRRSTPTREVVDEHKAMFPGNV